MSRLAALLLGLLLLAPATAQAQVLAYPSGVAGLVVNNCATTNRLLYLSSTAVTGCSTLSYDGTNVTLTSGVLILTPTLATTTIRTTGRTDNTGIGGTTGVTAGATQVFSYDTARFSVDGNNVAIPGTIPLGWTAGALPTTDALTVLDVVLGRAAAANLRLGAAAANPPVAQTLSVQNASGTDIAGANFTQDMSQGTGTGTGGSWIVRTAAAGGTGSSLNALAVALTIDSTRAVTTGLSTAVHKIGYMTFNADIFSSDGVVKIRPATNDAFIVQTGAGADILNIATTAGTAASFAGSTRVTPPATQTIAATETVTADACGSIKRVTAASAVTTNTTDTFTAPAAGNAGCVMHVVNVGVNNITLDTNANFVSPGAADVVLGPSDAIIVGSTGASGAWYALSALVAN